MREIDVTGGGRMHAELTKLERQTNANRAFAKCKVILYQPVEYQGFKAFHSQNVEGRLYIHPSHSLASVHSRLTSSGRRLNSKLLPDHDPKLHATQCSQC